MVTRLWHVERQGVELVALDELGSLVAHLGVPLTQPAVASGLSSEGPVVPPVAAAAADAAEDGGGHADRALVVGRRVLILLAGFALTEIQNL